jgi:hypothetical protein
MASKSLKTNQVIEWRRIKLLFDNDFKPHPDFFQSHLEKIKLLANTAGAKALNEPLTRTTRNNEAVNMFFHIRLTINDFEEDIYKNSHRLMQLYSLVYQSPNPIMKSFSKGIEWFMLNYLMHTEFTAEKLLDTLMLEKKINREKSSQGYYVLQKMPLIRHADNLLCQFCQNCILEQKRLKETKYHLADDTRHACSLC